MYTKPNMFKCPKEDIETYLYIDHNYEKETYLYIDHNYEEETIADSASPMNLS